MGVRGSGSPSAWEKATAALILIVGVGIISWVLRWTWQLVSSIPGYIQKLSSEQWALIGEVLRNTGGWAALIAAIGTMTIMVITNKERAKEAASSDFRQHIQWAVEKVSSDNQFEVSFAQSVIQHFATNRHRHLSKKEHQLVLDIQETLEKLQTLEEFPQPLGEKDDDDGSKAGQEEV